MKNPFTADRKLVAALEKRSIRVVFSSGYTLFRQGESPKGLYILCSGEASLVMKSPAGTVLMTLQVPSGSLLGLPGIVANESYTFSASACPGSEVRFVCRKDFEDLIQEEPRLLKKIQLKENIASYLQTVGHDPNYWPVISAEYQTHAHRPFLLLLDVRFDRVTRRKV